MAGIGAVLAQSPTDPESTARGVLAARAAADPVLRSRHVSASSGTTHLVYQQSAAGVPIKNGTVLINIARDGSVINVHGQTGASAPAGRSAGVPMPHGAAMGRAAALLGPIDGEPVPPRQEWFRLPSGTLVLSWVLTVRRAADRMVYEMVLDAASGEELARAPMTHGIGTYLVAPLPATDPDDEPRRLVAEAADPLASPFGWHDTNGAPGADFTDTRGNNVFVQDDDDVDNLFGDRPSGGASLVFDFAPAAAFGSVAERDSGLVSLFYTVNICHDLFYRYGFTEAAGNFQENNYGRGGAGGDAVRADTEDPGAVGNALFFTPNDGIAGRMELGTLIRPSTLTVVAPASLTGVVGSAAGNFGGRTGPAGLSGRLVAAIDPADAAGPSTTDCCTAPTNAAELVGNIALIDRGDCNFDDKVRNAQEAGAIGVIIANNAGDVLVTMNGDDQAVTIPAIFVGQSDGGALRAALGEPVDVTLEVPPDLNYADDATIVVHEFGHGVTNRLTGGRFDGTCLTGLVSAGLGEGWSDYFALALTQDPADTRATPRRIGSYAFPPSGLRTAPYSALRSVNSLTYAAVAQRGEVHQVGEIWCAALWDLHWDLVRHYGSSEDLYAPFATGGENLALQLVVDALQLQPCSPGFLDARDAILTADAQLTAGANQFLIWNAFARRGIGQSATQGAGPTDNAVTEAFDLPPALDLADDDDDGAPNLIEAALGSDALSPGSVPKVTVVMVAVGPDMFPGLRFRREVGGVGFVYSLETGDALDGFTPIATVLEATAPAEPGFETVTLRSSAPVVPGVSRRFLRLRVTRAGP